MTAFSLLSQEQRLLLIGILFIAALIEFALCLYKHFCRSSLRSRAFNDLALCAIFFFCAYLTASSRSLNRPLSIPWIIIPAISVTIAIYSTFGIMREYREKKRRLSPYSVKEAIDNLNMGLLFADETGKTVLVNNTMASLYSSVAGRYPQTAQELMKALELLDKSSGLYRFSDGRVWSVQTQPLNAQGLKGFSQTMAIDMTELYNANKELETENETLRQAIEKMRKMLDLVAERSREHETLELKMRIHNDIGTSLVALSRLMEENALTDSDAQIETLENAASYFAGRAPTPSGTIEEAFIQAEKLNIRLEIRGNVPNKAIESLVTAAAKECVTNCARHARGRSVSVEIKELCGIYTVTITNDGEPPRGTVIEGGGLSALRKKVERAGGEMQVTVNPAFALILNLPGKELQE